MPYISTINPNYRLNLSLRKQMIEVIREALEDTAHLVYEQFHNIMADMWNNPDTDSLLYTRFIIHEAQILSATYRRHFTDDQIVTINKLTREFIRLMDK